MEKRGPECQRVVDTLFVPRFTDSMQFWIATSSSMPLIAGMTAGTVLLVLGGEGGDYLSGTEEVEFIEQSPISVPSCADQIMSGFTR